MKQFIIQNIIFLLVLSIFVNIEPVYLLITKKYKNIVAGSSNYHSIKKSKERNTSKILIIGDSVGRQLFDNYQYNDTLNSLTCNVGISMVGQFILLKNYIDAGNTPDKVVLIYTPFSFKNNLNNNYTYHYFLKPFYKKEYTKYFTKTVSKQIQKIPFHLFCQYPIILTNNWAPELEIKDSINLKFLSPISIEYINKIKKLSLLHNFKFYMLPTPTRDSYRSKIRNIKNEVQKGIFQKEFNYYFSQLFFINDSFFIDDVHLKNPEKYSKILKKTILEDF